MVGFMLQNPANIAARPLYNAYFQNDRDTIENRSGRRLKDLTCQSQVSGFDLNSWISGWEAGGKESLIPGKN